jgi:hypothetical protein
LIGYICMHVLYRRQNKQKKKKNPSTSLQDVTEQEGQEVKL